VRPFLNLTPWKFFFGHVKKCTSVYDCCVLAAALLLATGIYAVVEVNDSGAVTVSNARKVTLAAPIEPVAATSEWTAVLVTDGYEKARVPLAIDDTWRVEYDDGGTIAASRQQGTRTVVVRLPYEERGRLEIQRRGSTLASLDVKTMISASEADLVTLGSSGPPRNRLDLLLVGDGYTSAERAKFFADAQRLMNSFFSISPYREYGSFVNSVALFTPSAQSGADHPHCSDPASNDDPKRGTLVNTAFDATYCGNGTFRGVTVNAAKVYEAAAAYPEWDRIGVIVNDGTYGGSGGPVWVVSTHAQAAEIAQHEFGHSFSGLTDEYTSPWSGATFCSDAAGSRPCEPNATDDTARARLKWAPWVETATPIPTPSSEFDVLGLFEGARYQTTGFYRSRFRCLMKAFGTNGVTIPFCEVCRQTFVLRLYEGWSSFTPQKIELIEHAAPAAPLSVNVGSAVTFSAGALQTANDSVQRQWSVNGTVMDAAADTFTFTPTTAGLYEIRLEVADTTPFVRPIRPSMSATHTWQLTAGSFPKRRAARQ
jgi:hypothetical protein